MISDQRGFTMVELLIVVAIIAVLSIVSGGAYLNSLNRSRDAKYISDLQTIQKGFETYYLKGNKYDSNAECATIKQDPTIFPNGIPTDPDKTYQISCSTPTTYCACVELKNPKHGANSGADCAFSAAANLKTNYCVQALQ